MTSPGAEQLTGRSQRHLKFRDGVGLTPACWAAFDALREDAAAAGFDLAIASGFRDFERQLAIFNAKVSGERPVHGEDGTALDATSLQDGDKLAAILRFSALPGASRHHWGTDLDVFDAASLPAGYQVQLSPAEVAEDGIFGPLHAWLDSRIAAGESHGFYRPYDVDRGGVAVERWHLSYAPEALACEQAMSVGLLEQALASCELALAAVVRPALPDLYQRYVCAVSPPPEAVLN